MNKLTRNKILDAMFIDTIKVTIPHTGMDNIMNAITQFNGSELNIKNQSENHIYAVSFAGWSFHVDNGLIKIDINGNNLATRVMDENMIEILDIINYIHDKLSMPTINATGKNGRVMSAKMCAKYFKPENRTYLDERNPYEKYLLDTYGEEEGLKHYKMTRPYQDMRKDRVKSDEYKIPVLKLHEMTVSRLDFAVNCRIADLSKIAFVQHNLSQQSPQKWFDPKNQNIVNTVATGDRTEGVRIVVYHKAKAKNQAETAKKWGTVDFDRMEWSIQRRGIKRIIKNKIDIREIDEFFLPAWLGLANLCINNKIPVYKDNQEIDILKILKDPTITMSPPAPKEVYHFRAILGTMRNYANMPQYAKIKKLLIEMIEDLQIGEYVKTGDIECVVLDQQTKKKRIA